MLNKTTEKEKIYFTMYSIIDKIIMIYSFMLNQFKTCNPAFIYDIKKYYLNTFKLFDNFKNNELKNLFIELIKKGKEDKLFTSGIYEEIIFKIHLKKFNTIIDKELLPKKDLFEPIFSKIMKYSIINISIIKGHKLIEEKSNKIK